MAESFPTALPAGHIDDCWQRIGVRGDRSCPLLAEHIHCRNCPAYSRAALAVLDARATVEQTHQDAHEAGMEPEGHDATVSCLVFRVGDEWLALPAAAIGEVTAPCPVHSLPHRQEAAMLGLASVRGSLLACISLERLFGMTASAGAKDTSTGTSTGSATGAADPAGADHQHRAMAGRPGERFLVLGQGRSAIALPVAEVSGIRRIGQSALQPLPATLARASARYTQALFTDQGRSVGLLDGARVRQALTRSLA